MIVYRCVPSAHVSAYMSQQVCLDKCEWGDGRARARVCVLRLLLPIRRLWPSPLCQSIPHALQMSPSLSRAPNQREAA